MAKGPRTKVAGEHMSQAERDARSKHALAKGGAGKLGKQESIKHMAEKAEMDSFKLNRKQKF